MPLVPSFLCSSDIELFSETNTSALTQSRVLKSVPGPLRGKSPMIKMAKIVCSARSILALFFQLCRSLEACIHLRSAFLSHCLATSTALLVYLLCELEFVHWVSSYTLLWIALTMLKWFGANAWIEWSLLDLAHDAGSKILMHTRQETCTKFNQVLINWGVDSLWLGQ